MSIDPLAVILGLLKGASPLHYVVIHHFSRQSLMGLRDPKASQLPVSTSLLYVQPFLSLARSQSIRVITSPSTLLSNNILPSFHPSIYPSIRHAVTFFSAYSSPSSVYHTLITYLTPNPTPLILGSLSPDSSSAVSGIGSLKVSTL